MPFHLACSPHPECSDGTRGEFRHRPRGEGRRLSDGVAAVDDEGGGPGDLQTADAEVADHGLPRVEALGRGEVEVTADWVLGQTTAEITRAASVKGASAIVMGTHGRGGLAHAIMGSVAERTVRTARCPVPTAT